MATPGYIAPEQLLGQPVDARADLFSIAVMLYEMLTGKSPFEGRTPPCHNGGSSPEGLRYR